jgi:hypothetical protein
VFLDFSRETPTLPGAQVRAEARSLAILSEAKPSGSKSLAATGKARSAFPRTLLESQFAPDGADPVADDDIGVEPTQRRFDAVELGCNGAPRSATGGVPGGALLQT